MTKTEPKNGKFELLVLPYAPDALDPIISRQTIEFHHGKHLQTYVDNLNGLIPGTAWEGKALEDIVKESTGGIANNAGQILNHNLYFSALAPAKENNAPEGALLDAIKASFGSFEQFQQDFEKAGTTLFGSGWVWLAQKKDGSLVITQETNAGNPVQHDLIPLLTFDVWEHAYYLDFQNRRAAQLHALWPLVNWSVVASRLEA